MTNTNRGLARALAAALLLGCGDGPTPTPPESGEIVPELGDASRSFVVVATGADGLSIPRDLAFHPLHQNELWTVNRGIEGTVTLFGAGTSAQRVMLYASADSGITMHALGATAETKQDAFRAHFMQQVISIAMGANGTFATCHEGTQQFMGPTLWNSDTAVYAKRDLPGWGGLGSHIDMLHQTQHCLGIEHERDNVFWVSDGTKGNIARYDFREDHGPGHDDHSDGVVRRYGEARVTRLANVPGHMALDAATGWLYYADPGGKRVMRLNTTTGQVAGVLTPFGEMIDYREVTGAAVETVVAKSLTRPSGLALHGGRLFVTDNATNEIVAFAIDGRELQRVKTPAQGIMGITMGPDGRIWYVDGLANTVVRLDP